VDRAMVAENYIVDQVVEDIDDIEDIKDIEDIEDFEGCLGEYQPCQKHQTNRVCSQVKDLWEFVLFLKIQCRT